MSHDLVPDDALLRRLLEMAAPDDGPRAGLLRRMATGMLRRSAEAADPSAVFAALLHGTGPDGPGEADGHRPDRALARAIARGAFAAPDEERAVRRALRAWATARVAVCDPTWTPGPP